MQTSMTMRILKICTRNAETYPQILGKLHGLDSFQTQKCNLHPKKHHVSSLEKGGHIEHKFNQYTDELQGIMTNSPIQFLGEKKL